MLNHSDIIRIMQHDLLGLIMSSVDEAIAHKIIDRKNTARMLGNLRFLDYEINLIHVNIEAKESHVNIETYRYICLCEYTYT